MVKKIEKVNLNWEIPETVKDKFQSYCDVMGETGKDSLAGAMIIWTYLPASIQRAAKLEAKGVNILDKNIWDEFADLLENAILNQNE